MPKWRAAITRVSATEVRELVSSAMVRTRSIGTDVKSATDRTGPSDAMAQSGDDRVAVTAQVLDRRDQPEVDVAVMQERRARARQVVADVEAIGPAIQSVDQWARVEIRDGPNPNRRHQLRSPKRPSRSAGSPEAATMFRRISSSGARRRPRSCHPRADTPSTSSAPKVSATCASFGP